MQQVLELLWLLVLSMVLTLIVAGNIIRSWSDIMHSVRKEVPLPDKIARLTNANRIISAMAILAAVVNVALVASESFTAILGLTLAAIPLGIINVAFYIVFDDIWMRHRHLQSKIRLR